MATNRGRWAGIMADGQNGDYNYELVHWERKEESERHVQTNMGHEGSRGIGRGKGRGKGVKGKLRNA